MKISLVTRYLVATFLLLGSGAACLDFTTYDSVSKNGSVGGAGCVNLELSVDISYCGFKTKKISIYKNGRLELYQGNSYECSPRNESIAKRDIIGDYHFFTIKTLFHPTILSTSAGTVHYYVSKDPVLINKTKNSILKLGHVNFHPEEILIVSYNNISSKRNITKNNTYQVALASSGNASYLILIYQDVQWLEYYGVPATIVYECDCSEVSNVEDFVFESNIGDPGVHIYALYAKECLNGNGGCAHNCSNTDGSFVCSCYSGYELGTDGMACNDINECLSSNGAGCAHNCSNTDGSFVCSCVSGYELGSDGMACNDINECLSSNGAGCAHNCSNTNGSFVCSCVSGYELGTDGMACNDINECLSSNGAGCAHNCSNTDGSFVCSCVFGYELGTDGMACNDIDECAVNSSGCEQNCTNTNGSFQCNCSSGSLAEDGLLCASIGRSTAVAASSAVISILIVLAVGIVVAVVLLFLYKNTKKSPDTPVSIAMQDNPGYDVELKHEYEQLGCDQGTDSVFMEPVTNEDELYQQIKDIGIRSIKRDKLKINESLGSGQFGLVNRGVWSSPHGDIDVALKTLNDDASQEDRVKFLQEAAIMGQFKHLNVVQLYGIIIHGQPVMLVVEIMSKGDLKKYLLSLKSDSLAMVQSKLLLGFSQQVAQGMQYLSSKNFIHRDLAARNILVSGDNICKVADFGMSRNLADENYYVSHGGKIPVKWTAPEALFYKKYSTASDVWSYGCLLYEIWSLGHEPMELLQNSEVVTYLSSGQRLPPPPGCPEIVYKLMIQCWHPEASERPAFSDILLDYEARLLFIPKEALETNPQAGVLGAPLEAGKGMYIVLQDSYFD